MSLIPSDLMKTGAMFEAKRTHNLFKFLRSFAVLIFLMLESLLLLLTQLSHYKCFLHPSLHSSGFRCLSYTIYQFLNSDLVRTGIEINLQKWDPGMSGTGKHDEWGRQLGSKLGSQMSISTQSHQRVNWVQRGKAKI